MTKDAQAAELLNEVVGEWNNGGVLRVLRELVSEVWTTNSTRYEPRLGDDALTLGVQSSRNLCNRAVQQLGRLEGVSARDIRTLEVRYAGRVLHTSKVGSASPTWDIDLASWVDSDVRISAAAANSAVYKPVTGTLFERALCGQPVNPTQLRHLHLAWQGLPGGGTRVWVGFPCQDIPPWFAVTLLDEPSGGGGRRTDGDAIHPPPTPDFDTLGEPSIPLTRRIERVDRRDGRGA